MPTIIDRTAQHRRQHTERDHGECRRSWTAQHRSAGCETGARETREGFRPEPAEGGIGWGGVWSNDRAHPDVRTLAPTNCVSGGTEMGEPLAG